jgi:hypothetical protein
MWFILFLPYICNAVKLQGWKEKEDRPVIAGEEALDKVLKPYAEDSRMNMMFDFSNMEAFDIQDDIQQQSLRPKKKGKHTHTHTHTHTPQQYATGNSNRTATGCSGLGGTAEASTP